MTFNAFFLQSKFDASGGWHSALVDEFLNIRVPTQAQFTEHLLASRLVRMINLQFHIVFTLSTISIFSPIFPI